MSATPYPGTRQCDGKRVYRTKQDAKRAARATNARGGRRVHAYRCGQCDYFHLGHDAAFVPKEEMQWH
jgi:hypothetical protein